MRPGVSLAGFTVAAETTNLAGRAVEFGSQAGAARPRLGVVRADGPVGGPTPEGMA